MFELPEIPIRENPYRKPGFSFGSRNEPELDEATRGLGPGHYNVNRSTLEKSGKTFSKADRFKGPSISTQSPNLHEKKTPTTVLLKSLTDPKKISMKPFENSVSFSKAPKNTIFSEASFHLGPGQYDVKREFEHRNQLLNSIAETSKMTSSKTYTRFQYPKQNGDTPGPGQYDLSIFSPMLRKDGVKFGSDTSERYFIDPKVVLKQGLNGKEYYKYNQQQALIGKGSPKHSFPRGRKVFKKTVNDVPGPGTYFPEDEIYEKLATVKTTWGKAPRNIHGSSKELELGPGPGEYDIASPVLKRDVKLNKSPPKRETVEPAQEASPGPGQYDILTEFEMKKAEIQKQLNLSQSRIEFKMNNPKNSKMQETNRKLKPLTRWIDLATKSSVSPGPKYLVETDSIEDNIGTLGTKFSNFSREGIAHIEIKKDVPGPGSYMDYFYERDSPSVGFSTSKRKENPLLPEHTIGLPGPDHYDPILDKSVVGGDFAKAIRKLEVVKTISGNKQAKKKKYYGKV